MCVGGEEDKFAPVEDLCLQSVLLVTECASVHVVCVLGSSSHTGVVVVVLAVLLSLALLSAAIFAALALFSFW